MILKSKLTANLGAKFVNFHSKFAKFTAANLLEKFANSPTKSVNLSKKFTEFSAKSVNFSLKFTKLLANFVNFHSKFANFTALKFPIKSCFALNLNAQTKVGA